MFRRLFERSADAILLFDPAQGVFVDCNAAAVALIRADSKRQLLDCGPARLSPPCQPDGQPSATAAAAITARIQREGTHRFEWVIRRFDGGDVPIEAVATQILDHGRELHVVVCRDISERKQAEAELRGSQQLLMSLADNLSEAIYRTGPNHELTFANRAYLSMSGYTSLEEMRGLPRERLYANPSDRARLLRRLAREGGFRNEEIEYVRRDGVHWWGLTNSVAIRDPEFGAVLYHVGSVTDITERKQAEAALRASEDRFRRMFEQSADAISLLDVQTMRFIDVNPATARMLGYASPRELVGTTPEQDSPEFQPDGRRSAEKAVELISRALREGSIRFEWEGRRADGRGIPLEISVTRLELGAQPVMLMVSRDITERKRAEAEVNHLTSTLERRIAERTAELTASEARLRTLVEHAPEAIVVFDGDSGQFLSGNVHACRLYGRTAEELPTLSPVAVSPEFQPDGRPSVVVAREKMDEALAGGTPVFEWMHCHRSGRLVPTEVRLVRLPAEGQRLLRASIIDSTERKRRETIQQAILKISEAAHIAEDLEALYAQIHGIIQSLMPAKNLYLALVDEGGRSFSFPYLMDEHDLNTRAMPIDQGWTGYVLRSGKALLAGPHNLTAPEGQAVQLENGERIAAVNCGGRLPVVWLGAPLAVGGRTFGVVVVQDYDNPQAYGPEEKSLFTFVAGQIALAIERKRAGQALRESEEKFRAFFEASSTGIMIHDEHQYLDANPAIVKMFGYRDRTDLIGKSPLITSPPTQPDGQSTAELARRHIAECLQKGTARFDWLAQRADGRELPVEVILTRIEMGGRRVIQAVVTEIGERKRAEAELLRALAREKELSQLKTNFVSLVSHEFRTPLGIIMSSAEILDEYLDQLALQERREQLHSIQKNARHMAGLMEEALLLGRIEAGRMDFKPAPLDLRRFAERLVDEVHSATNHACPIQLSAAEPAVPAQADDRLLRHILINLLTNAVKYSAPGTPVEFQLATEGDRALFRVRDRGIGIPAEDREWLFEAFHRGRNVGERPGTGLGLTIVKRCVELHGGQIAVDSRVGEGTTMTVSLPVMVRAPEPQI